jgi:hypothetical protein
MAKGLRLHVGERPERVRSCTAAAQWGPMMARTTSAAFTRAMVSLLHSTPR